VQHATELPIFISTHPRTRKRLEALPDWDPSSNMTFSEPLGFHDYNKLQLKAACVLSDSGTIAEESSILGFPAVTIRDSMERPEALDTGEIMMTGLDASDIVTATTLAISSASGSVLNERLPDDYRANNTAERVMRFIISTARRLRQWTGIRP
jgi:UDP-N-acetylglucosamine 2-epimerase (non-hydrolysing)